MDVHQNGASPMSDHGESVRVIRPAAGVTIDDANFRLEDVSGLAQALISHTEGKLEALRNAADEVEARLRRQTSECRNRIQRAVDLSQQMIDERLRDAEHAAEAALEEGRARGFEEGKTSGFRSGYAEGLERGLLDGRSQGERAIRQELDRDVSGARSAVCALAAELELRWTELLADGRANLVRLALRAAQKIIRGHIENVPETVRVNLAAALDRLAEYRCITIEMNPADLQVVGDQIEELKRRLDENGAVRILPAESMARGGCVVQSGSGRVDLRIETQVEVLAARCRALDEVNA